jgi:hypothetical protein
MKPEMMGRLPQPEGICGTFPKEYIETKPMFINWWLGIRCEFAIRAGLPNIFAAYWGCWN